MQRGQDDSMKILLITEYTKPDDLNSILRAYIVYVCMYTPWIHSQTYIDSKHTQTHTYKRTYRYTH